jgi:hypothetical protein
MYDRENRVVGSPLPTIRRLGDSYEMGNKPTRGLEGSIPESEQRGVLERLTGGLNGPKLIPPAVRDRILGEYRFNPATVEDFVERQPKQ